MGVEEVGTVIKGTLKDHSYYFYQSIPVLLYCMRGSGCGS